MYIAASHTMFFSVLTLSNEKTDRIRNQEALRNEKHNDIHIETDILLET